MTDEAVELRAALVEVAAALAWLAFGELRAFEQFGHRGPPLKPAEADELARRVLTATGSQQTLLP